MVASAIFITDHNGKALISRNYRGDISGSVCKEFQKVLMENALDHECQPMMCCNSSDQNDITFCFIKHNDLHCMSCFLVVKHLIHIDKF